MRGRLKILERKQKRETDKRKRNASTWKEKKNTQRKKIKMKRQASEREDYGGNLAK